MLPIHEDTYDLLGLLAVAACAAVFAVRARRLRLWTCAAVLLAATIWPWPVAFGVGLDGYSIRLALFFGGWTFVAVMAGLVWGRIARGFTTMAAMLLVAVLPALAGAACLLERQRVPDAPCASHAVFAIGDIILQVPREMGARSAVAEDAPGQVWWGDYSAWPGAKPDVRALCAASGGGRDAVKVQHLWLRSSWFRKAREKTCPEAEGVQETGAYCAAAARTQLSVVQLYARPDGRPLPSLGHFSAEEVGRRLSGGETEGYRCNDATTGPMTRYCTIWLPLSPGVLAVASAKLGPPAVGEDPVQDAAIVLGTMLSSLHPANDPRLQPGQ